MFGGEQFSNVVSPNTEYVTSRSGHGNWRSGSRCHN